MKIPFLPQKGNYKITRDEFELARKIMQDMEALVASAGWKRIDQIGELHRSTREKEILEPESSGSSAVRKEHLRGERFGITLILQTPLVIIEEAKQVLALYRSQEKFDEDTETQVDGRSAGAGSSADTKPNVHKAP